MQLRNSAWLALEDHLTQTIIDTLPDDVWLLLDLITNNAHRGLSSMYNARDDLFDPEGYALDRFRDLLAAGRPDTSSRLPGHALIRVAPEGIAHHARTPLQRKALENDLAALQAQAYAITDTATATATATASEITP